MFSPIRVPKLSCILPIVFCGLIAATVVTRGGAVSAEDSVTADAAAIYATKCVACHGEDGRGVDDVYEQPFRMTRSVDDLANYIHDTMPEGEPETCVGDEARVVAAYVRDHLTPQTDDGDRPRLSRWTVGQYRNAVADLVGHFAVASLDELGRAERRGETPWANFVVPGLLGEYYQSRGMSKARRLGQFRSDQRMEFDFGAGSPAGSISPDQFAIIWEGSLRTDHTGHHEFRITTPNGARMYLNLDPAPRLRRLRDDSSMEGQAALIDAWVGSGQLREESARIFLLGGRSYPIRVEFFKYLEEVASLKVEWKPPHGAWSVIDFAHTTTAKSPRVHVCETPFPADDRSLGFERGVSASPEWQSAAVRAAIETGEEVLQRLPLLARLEQADDRAAAIERFVLEFARVAYRRPLEQGERERLQNVLTSDAGNPEAGVRRAIVMTLMSPAFLYPDLTPAGERPTAYAVASRLAAGLWDSIPDTDLVAAAERGQLRTVEQLERHAERMLDDPRTRAKIRSFFRSWLEIEDRDLAKDKELFPEFDEVVIADLRESLERFLDQVVWSRESDYRELLRADYLILNDRLRRLYPPPATSDQPLDGHEIKRRAALRQFASHFQPVEFPPDRRAGLLTHPYLLSAYAYHNSTSPIHRGVFLTRNIVGRALSPPPVAISFEDHAFEPDLTMREKVTRMTRDTACMSCHAVINPLGFSLENFDAIGRWRETDNAKPVDSTSDYTTVAGVTLQLAGPRDVAEFAAESPSAQAAFIRHLFEHLTKRSPNDFGPDILDRLQRQFAENNFHIRDLCVRIAIIAALEDLSPVDPLFAEDS